MSENMGQGHENSLSRGSALLDDCRTQIDPDSLDAVTPHSTAHSHRDVDSAAVAGLDADVSGPAGDASRDMPGESRTFPTITKAWRALVNTVADAIETRERLWVLEAGVGQRPLFNLPEDAYVVGVDRDSEALTANRRLDERVLSDLAGYRPWAAGFDLITCWYVLDQMPDPSAVLDHFAHWAGPDALIVLAVPNLRSPRGLALRARGDAKLRRCLTPAALRRRFGARGFVPVFDAYFETSSQIQFRRRFRVTRGKWKAAQVAVRLLSLGLLDAARTDYLVVFRNTAPTD